MKKTEIVINWFRQDLRIKDNPSLNFLSNANFPILNIYIFDEKNSLHKKIGRASKFWLHHSLKNLNNLLDDKLLIFKGCAFEVIKNMTEKYRINSFSWNRCYEPWRIKRDKRIKLFLESKNINVKTFNGSLLWEPWNILKADKTPYRVFTPYYRRGCLNYDEPRKPIKSKKLILYKDNTAQLEINDLKLLPDIRWDEKLIKNWDISDEGMEKHVDNFFSYGIKDYKEGRNFPTKKSVSRLSPYIHWGLVSPNVLWHKCNEIQSDTNEINIDHFKSELAWREFSYYLLYYFPELPNKNLQSKFDKFPWIKNITFLKRWCDGLTGYPIVDAGMRELWETGYMHNRIRMLVGSFLVKNLLIDWRYGEKWFWDCLVDADLGSNSASWQWVAGTGADAAPYFRIFNPITQGQKFDKDGQYTKKFLPELKNLPPKFLFNPWELSTETLADYGVHLGKNYPFPIIDIKESRNLALKAFSTIKIRDLNE